MNIFASSLKKSLITLCAIGLGVLAASSVHAQILLYVDYDQTTGLATITASLTNTAENDSGQYPINDGIDLNSFFVDAHGSESFTTSDVSLTPTLNTNPALLFDQAGADIDNVSNTDQALALYNGSGDTTNKIEFTTSTLALVGKLTVDLKGYAIHSGGNIIAGSLNGIADSPEVIIGTWTTSPPAEVPEPSTWMLLAGAVALLPWLHRLRRA